MYRVLTYGMNGNASLSGPSDSSSDDPFEDPGWVVAKTLLDANARSVRAFEQHLLWTYYRTEGDPAQTKRTLRQAIQDHERIIEDLELAIVALDELD